MKNRIRQLLYRLTLWLVKKNSGIPVTIYFNGDKGKSMIHMQVYLHYIPIRDKLVVDWDKKEVTVQRGGYFFDKDN